jgi:tryptophan synthase alpha chain
VNRIDTRFAALRERGESAFIPFVTAGDPTLARTGEIVLALERAGADIIELGVPFSDPIADGAVNQEAAQRALIHDITLHDVVGLVRDLRKTTEVPIILFTYYNPVLAYGVEDFAKDCADAGVDGALCVDLPPEEDPAYKAAMDTHNLATVFLAAPTTTPERMEILAKHSSGFLYYVSRTGVTGERADIESTVQGMVAEVKQHTNLPVAVGFGISAPEQAAEIGQYSDGVVVGSAIVRLIGESGDSDDTAAKVEAFVRPLADAAKGKGA